MSDIAASQLTFKYSLDSIHFNQTLHFTLFALDFVILWKFDTISVISFQCLTENYENMILFLLFHFNVWQKISCERRNRLTKHRFKKDIGSVNRVKGSESFLNTLQDKRSSLVDENKNGWRRADVWLTKSESPWR